MTRDDLLGLIDDADAADRVCLALALAERAGTLPEGVHRTTPRDERASVDLDAIDAPYTGHPFQTLVGGDDAGELVARGRALLTATWQAKRGNRLATLQAISPSVASRPRRSGEITIKLGKAPDDTPLWWCVNREHDDQNNANLRLAGQPGSGKSQFLLHLLADIAERSSTGFILFDYKGDLAGNSDFVRCTSAKVVRLGEEPVPVNPFEVPVGLAPQLVPSAFADVFAQAMHGHVGDVQKSRLVRAMEQAYDSGRSPTLTRVHECVNQVYDEDGAKPDSVLAVLDQLVKLGLFADRTEQTAEGVFGNRWVLDLSHLRGVQEFVAFVLMEHLHNIARSMGDSTFDSNRKTRRLRGIVAVDEAHYYLKRRCRPLLDLVRIGRSKGVPVFLSSQSIEDFRQHTELEEFLPNTFLFRHGKPPQAGVLQGALGLAAAQARRAADQVTSLAQFHVLTRTAGADPLQPVRVSVFFEHRP